MDGIVSPSGAREGAASHEKTPKSLYRRGLPQYITVSWSRIPNIATASDTSIILIILVVCYNKAYAVHT